MPARACGTMRTVRASVTTSSDQDATIAATTIDRRASGTRDPTQSSDCESTTAVAPSICTTSTVSPGLDDVRRGRASGRTRPRRASLIRPSCASTRSRTDALLPDERGRRRCGVAAGVRRWRSAIGRTTPASATATDARATTACDDERRRRARRPAAPASAPAAIIAKTRSRVVDLDAPRTTASRASHPVRSSPRPPDPRRPRCRRAPESAPTVAGQTGSVRRPRRPAAVAGRPTLQRRAPKVSAERAAVSVAAIGPAATTSPSRSSSTWVKPGGISSTWWVTRTMRGRVPGRRRAGRAGAPGPRDRRGRGPAAGSSSSSSSGSVISARAICTRLRSPSDSVPNAPVGQLAPRRAAASSSSARARRRSRRTPPASGRSTAYDAVSTTSRTARRAGSRSASAALDEPDARPQLEDVDGPERLAEDGRPRRGSGAGGPRRAAAAWSCRHRWARAPPSARPRRRPSRAGRAGSRRRAGRYTGSKCSTSDMRRNLSSGAPPTLTGVRELSTAGRLAAWGSAALDGSGQPGRRGRRDRGPARRGAPGASGCPTSRRR